MLPPVTEGTAPDPLIGRLVAQKFRIEQLIGQGSMGRVYLAEQTNLGKQVALKVLHTQMAHDPALAKRFHREARAASRLSHPNILQITDFGDDGGLLFIAMELLSGRDLYRAIKNDWPLAAERIGYVGGQILGALDEAHVKGVIHRDLKPENVMLIDVRGESDFVKVCDFGIAKVLSERDGEGSAITMAGMVCGTPEYMSPEQGRGDALDGRSDLYAMAVILYQMVCGDVPFRAESALGVITKHLSEQPVAPSKRNGAVPPALEAVILRGLRKNRMDRYASAAEMRVALLEAVGLRRGASSSGPAVRGDGTLRELATAATGVDTPAPMPSAGTPPTSVLSAPTPATPVPSAGTPVPSPSPSAQAVAFAVTAPRDVVPPPTPEPMPAVGATLPSQPPVHPSTGSVHGELAAAQAPAGRRVRGLIAGLAVAAAVVAALVMMKRPVPSSPSPPVAAPPPAAATAAPLTAPAAPVAPTAPPAPAPAPPHLHKREKVRATTSNFAAAPAVPAPPAPPPPGASPPPPSAPSAAARPAPTGFAALVADGEQLLRAGDTRTALARYQEAARLNPADAKTQRQIGRCYSRLGQQDRALPYFQRYLELAPDASDAAFIRAILDKQ
jgi:serine/threonine-protein kinase